MPSRRVPRVLVVSVFLLIAMTFVGDVFAQAPMATTGAATSVGSTEATVNGTVNANGASTTVFFEYGVNTAYGSTASANQSPVTGSTATAVSVALGELVPYTTYHFRLVATNANGTTNGSDMTFTSLPAAPSVLTSAATSIGATGATLNGVVNANGDSATVTFEYGTDSNYGTTVTADQSPVSSSSAIPVSRAITGLVNNTTYHYRVVAVNAGGTSIGADMTFTAGSPGAAPTATTGAATAVNATGATLNGTANASGADTVVSFEFGVDTNYGSVVLADESPVSGSADTAVSASISELAPNTNYHFRVVATNANGTTNGADGTFTTLPFPPTAVTDSAVLVDATNSTLNGTVSANDASTTVTFSYGPDTNYGTTVTADLSPVTGSMSTAVSSPASGLTTGNTYHFRVVAQNAGGTAEGQDMSFVAGAPAPAATTGAASEIDTSTATLNGTVTANGQNATITFEFGFDTGYGRVIDAIPYSVSGTADTAVAVPVADLLPNVTYHFRVVATSGGGTALGSDVTFSTLAAPSVTTGAASVVGTSGATLNGTVSANGLSATVTFEYGTDTNYGTTVSADQSPVTSADPTAVSVAVTGLTVDQTYHYRTVGVNANGTTYGGDQTFLTSAPAAPVATTDAATLIVTDGATLNGTVTANNADTTVTFEYGADTGYGMTVAADQGLVSGTDPTAVSAAISGLTLGNIYHYRVVGVNANGTTHGTNMIFTTTNGAGAETGAASALTTTSATLNGTVNPNTDTGSAAAFFDYGLTAFYGSSIGAVPTGLTGFENIAVSGQTSGLTQNTTYHYRVVAYLTPFVGYSFGADRTFTTPTLGPAPTAVTVAATGVGSTSATFNGMVNANDTSTGVVFEYGFDTNYGSVLTAEQSPVTGTTDTAVSRMVDSLVPNTTFHYRVVAQNADNTVRGADMTLTTSGAPPTVATGAASAVSETGATLNGTVNPLYDPTTVTFEYGLDTNYGTTVTADQSPVNGNASTAVSVTITGLTQGATYHFRIVAQNGSGTVAGEDMAFSATAVLPTAVTNAPSPSGADGVVFNGTVNANGNSTVVTFEFGTTTAYGRSVPADQSPVAGAGDTAVSATVGGLVPGTTYHYRLVAENVVGTVYGDDQGFVAGALAAIPMIGDAAILLLVALMLATGIVSIRRVS